MCGNSKHAPCQKILKNVTIPVVTSGFEMPQQVLFFELPTGLAALPIDRQCPMSFTCTAFKEGGVCRLKGLFIPSVSNYREITH